MESLAGEIFSYYEALCLIRGNCNNITNISDHQTSLGFRISPIQLPQKCTTFIKLQEIKYCE